MDNVSSSSTLFSPQPSKFAQFYKRTSFGNVEDTQEKRRNERLQTIKQKRDATLNEKRNITDVFNDCIPIVENAEEPMETCRIHRRKKRKYADKLMISEWLIEKPDDLETQWLVKLCPMGARNLIVAHKARTRSYNKKGYFITEFASQLPGGSPSSTPNKFTILDCIYSEDSKTYFVLDVLAWNSFSAIQQSTDFRFFFLESKLQETPALREICKGNQFMFCATPFYQPQMMTLENIFAHFSNQLDGVLFYHKECCYLSEVTPLVGWLKAFMLPELFNITIHNDFLCQKPDNYTTYLDYIQSSHKLRKKKLRDVEMKEEHNDFS